MPEGSLPSAKKLIPVVNIEVECPKLTQWEKRCKQRESVSEVLPDGKVQYDLHKKFYGIE